MFNWLQTIIKNAIISALEARPDLFKGVLGHSVLSKEHPNMIEIDVGQMPRAKAEDHMRKQAELFKDLIDQGYHFIFVPKARY